MIVLPELCRSNGSQIIKYSSFKFSYYVLGISHVLQNIFTYLIESYSCGKKIS